MSHPNVTRKIKNTLTKQAHTPMPYKKTNKKMPEDFGIREQDKALQTIDHAAVAKLRQATGEGNRGEFEFIPRLRWHKHGDEKKGFYIYRGMDDGGQEIVEEKGDSVSCTFLVKREYLDMWKGDVHFFTHRFDSWKETVTLFQRNVKTGGDKIEVESGTIKELRGKYTAKDPVRGEVNMLKLHQIWYIKINGGSPVEIDLKGAALKEFFEYQKEIHDKKLSVAAVMTKMVVSQPKTHGNVTYVTPTFSMESQITDFDPIFDLIGEIRNGITIMKAQFEKEEDAKDEEVKEAL